MGADVAKGTCKMDGCDRTVMARGICQRHYQRFRTAGTLEDHADPSALGTYHRITEADPDAKVGICSICGPVRIRIRVGRGTECNTMRRRHRGLPDVPRPKSSGSPRSRKAQSRYKVSSGELEALVARAGGCCEICDAPTDFESGAKVDHCHETGLVRGLLCGRCNIAIGWFRDDPRRVLSAYFYLTSARADTA